MKTTTIKLTSIMDVKEFVNIVTRCNYDVDIVSGRYVVDAKSIMGLFGLDLSKELTVQAHTDDADELFEELAKLK
ncbi:MAG: HPr family phosphocarrier protein [Clostridia bacterium]|nr:HPr family phosphocarrier protein [Clostridia bacterium]